ncbi:MAG: polysaccharide biosynthesis protein PslG [Solirubrobacteraceae bacterium]|jgi:hypothetical protein|nr:polysaccharide biosynthesis protein PslG [Solirubrobacteraceae bacterium]
MARLRHLAAALAACALLGGALPAAAGAVEPGVVLATPDLGNGALQRIQSSGARHVRIFTSWRVFESTRGRLSPNYLASFDDSLNRLKALGIGVYLVVTQTPSWASQSGAENAAPPAAAYADFLGRLAEHFRGRVLAYEVWNEPDGNIFWAGGASPAEYAALLRPAYAAVKSADPGAKVGVGGLIGNDYNYVGGLYNAGAKGSFDFVSVHTDTACAATDPRLAARDVDGRISRWSFTGYREIRATMLAHGDAKPIWMTELGWQVTSRRCPVNARDPGGVTASAQALFLTRAYACLAHDPYMERGSWFSLIDFGTTDATGGGYGLFDAGGSARPSLGSFQRARTVGADRRCGLTVDTGAASIAISLPVEGSGFSGDLRYRALATDDQGVRTIALLVDGKQVRITRGRLLAGVWRGWRRVTFRSHAVTFRVIDTSGNVSSKTVNVRHAPWGAGEAVSTRVSARLFGSGRQRVAAGRLFTIPAEAKRFLRASYSLAFQRRAGSGWVSVGAVSGPASRALSLRRTLGPGSYRVLASFAGYGSFRASVAQRAFVVR